MKFLATLSLLMLAACAKDASHTVSSLSDGSTVHTVRCEENWDACYLAAARICGDQGFEEVARNIDSALSSAGRLERMHTVEGSIDEHRYSENTETLGYNRVISFRCGEKP